MVERTVSATEARTHLGELMRDIAARDQPVIVERDGKEIVAIVSIQRYRGGLDGGVSARDWWRRLKELDRMVDRDLAGREMPDPAEEIRRAREERDHAIDDAILGLR